MPERGNHKTANPPHRNDLDSPETVNLTDPRTLVCKFGGTSLADASRIARAAGIVARMAGPPEAGRVPVVVVSAMAGVTRELLALLSEGGAAPPALPRTLLARHREAARALGAEEEIEALLDALPDRFAAAPSEAALRDAVAATGEDLSALLMTAALRAEGIAAHALDARAVIRTDGAFGRAIPDDETTVALVAERMAPLIGEGTAPVLQGFIGADAHGRTTTLGRGGSDFTAAIVGAALGAREVTIFTDVDGIFSADPGEVPGARILPELGYEEAVELAWFGARVVHPAAAKHAAARKVALRIRNTFHPDGAGTLIRPDRRETPGVAALAHRTGSVLVRVRSRPLFMAHGFLGRVFGILARHGIAVDLVATSHTSTAFTLERPEGFEAARAELEAVAEVEVIEGLATVSAVGRGLLTQPGAAAELFRLLAETPVHLVSQASDTSLSFLVEEGSAGALVRRLHEGLLEHPRQEAAS